MDVKTLDKSCYSEWVVRNSLYWLSAVSEWTLEESDTHWQITLVKPGSDTNQELSRLLNDYLLRERLMAQTDALRSSIVTSVLVGIQERLTK